MGRPALGLGMLLAPRAFFLSTMNGARLFLGTIGLLACGQDRVEAERWSEAKAEIASTTASTSAGAAPIAKSSTAISPVVFVFHAKTLRRKGFLRD